jgi:hypothetical protein
VNANATAAKNIRVAIMRRALLISRIYESVSFERF